MVGGPSSEIAHAPRVIIADLVSVAVVDVHHVFDALLAAAHGHFPSQREASAQGVETRLGYVGRVLLYTYWLMYAPTLTMAPLQPALRAHNDCVLSDCNRDC